MKIFTENLTCKSVVHCVSCRDKKGGRLFRESLAAVFVRPEGAPDFVCPHGKKWGYTVPSKGLGDSIEKVTKAIGIKPCGGCGKRKENLNKMFPYKEE